MKLWKHALECKGQRIIIYSPNTDVYNVGLTYVTASEKSWYKLIYLMIIHKSI